MSNECFTSSSRDPSKNLSWDWSRFGGRSRERDLKRECKRDLRERDLRERDRDPVPRVPTAIPAPAQVTPAQIAPAQVAPAPAQVTPAPATGPMSLVTSTRESFQQMWEIDSWIAKYARDRPGCTDEQAMEAIRHYRRFPATLDFVSASRKRCWIRIGDFRRFPLCHVKCTDEGRPVLRAIFARGREKGATRVTLEGSARDNPYPAELAREAGLEVVIE